MATKNASNHQGRVKDPEHDGRLKGHKGCEAGKAHEKGTEEKHAGPKKSEAKHEDQADRSEHATTSAATSDKKSVEKVTKLAKVKFEQDSDKDGDFKSREYTDAEGKVHHHTKPFMKSQKGEGIAGYHVPVKKAGPVWAILPTSDCHPVAIRDLRVFQTFAI